MSSLFDFANILSSDTDNRQNYSVSRPPRFPISGMIQDEIQSDEQYRPDKVADRIYNDPSLSWIIDEANNWFHLKEYTIGKKFLYPNENTLIQMGIL